MKILLAVDGSDCTRRMLAYLAAHEELLGTRAEYVAVTALPAVPAYAAKHLDHQIMDEYYRDEAELVFRPIRAFAAQQPWQIRFIDRTGDAATVIAAVAEAEKPDQIVMGSHGRTALRNVLLGSVVTGVLARTKIPVLLIH
ncbi:MAG: universal stress protein [Burkholderiaceae bacterium]